MFSLRVRRKLHVKIFSGIANIYFVYIVIFHQIVSIIIFPIVKAAKNNGIYNGLGTVIN